METGPQGPMSLVFGGSQRMGWGSCSPGIHVVLSARPGQPCPAGILVSVCGAWGYCVAMYGLEHAHTSTLSHSAHEHTCGHTFAYMPRNYVHMHCTSRHAQACRHPVNVSHAMCMCYSNACTVHVRHMPCTCMHHTPRTNMYRTLDMYSPFCLSRRPAPQSPGSRWSPVR